MSGKYIVHGSDCSYYTGKIEAYLRAKDIDYHLEPFTVRGMRRCARATGVMQIPQIERPDGSWLVDTTPTIAYLETIHPDPPITPRDPVVRFIALLLEDYADEWLWRPAMHYRWSFRETARLMSGRLAEHLRGIPVPMVLKKRHWYRRQLGTFVKRDGVNATTRAAVEASYHDTLDALDAIFAERPFVLGARPTEADFGFFASMFRHFFCDPTPARIMREKAPGVHEWVARMWSLKPVAFELAPMPEELPTRLEPLLGAVSSIYLPYLAANAAAHAQGKKDVEYDVQGVSWSEPVKPYRVWCLGELHPELMALSEDDRAIVAAALDHADALAILENEPASTASSGLAELPIAAGSRTKPVDSWWRGR